MTEYEENEREELEGLEQEIEILMSEIDQLDEEIDAQTATIDAVAVWYNANEKQLPKLAAKQLKKILGLK